MKVVFIDTSPIRRGAQVFIAELSDSLDKMGIQTTRIYLYQAEAGAAVVTVRPQDRVLGFDSGSFLEKIPTLQPRLIRALKSEVSKIQPDLILLNGSRTLKYGSFLKRFFPAEIKWVSRIIDNVEFWNSGKFTHWYYKNLVIPQLDATVAVSEASLNSMIRHYGFHKTSIVIHRMFDPAKFAHAPSRMEARKQLGLGDDDEVLIFLGNLTFQKRPDRFVEIVSKLVQTRPRVKALIVGDGPMRMELEMAVSCIRNQVSGVQNASVFGLQSSVFFIGYQQDVSPFLAATDLLILTSDTEGLPGVVLEAAYFGVPTVATEVGGIKECLINEETGYLILDRSVDAFCEKIDFLLNNPEALLRMGQNAQSFVIDHFNFDQVATQYFDFFQSLLHKTTYPESSTNP